MSTRTGGPMPSDMRAETRARRLVRREDLRANSPDKSLVDRAAVSLRNLRDRDKIDIESVGKPLQELGFA
ncbi:MULTISPECIES: hypothetical protein [unclassified Frankia]|uniref:hypothetical protein n=1 Tax=unclassified Frankia TaxID=2632575 RepID=UPI00136560EB|nr:MULTISPECIES: hypothetical protein [unclassified Frankia]